LIDEYRLPLNPVIHAEGRTRFAHEAVAETCGWGRERRRRCDAMRAGLAGSVSRRGGRQRVAVELAEVVGGRDHEAS
jgi:hypothetical protein